MKKDHRGISLGTYVMLGVTGAVLLGCFLILPGLLGQARGTVDVRQVLSIFQTDGMPSLTLSDIPITRGDSTGNLPAPEPTQPPAETAGLCSCDAEALQAAEAVPDAEDAYADCAG